MKYEGERDEWEEMIARQGVKDEGERRVGRWEMRRLERIRGVKERRNQAEEGAPRTSEERGRGRTRRREGRREKHVTDRERRRRGVDEEEGGHVEGEQTRAGRRIGEKGGEKLN